MVTFQMDGAVFRKFRQRLGGRKTLKLAGLIWAECYGH